MCPLTALLKRACPLYIAARQVLASVQLSDAPRACGKEDQQLLTQLLQSPRYADILLDGYENIFDPVRQEQFAALTLHLPDGSAAVAFRGTDGTLVGWKEDFNMAFSTVVPAQLDAVRYLSDVAERTQGGIYLCGHSKGGNLAVYAAAFCAPEVQQRILGVRNFDGPGFTQQVLSQTGFARILPRVRTYLPRSSVVGMLLEHEEAFTIVESRSVGIYQHNVYQWEIARGGFVELQQLSASSHLMDRALKGLGGRHAGGGSRRRDQRPVRRPERHPGRNRARCARAPQAGRPQGRDGSGSRNPRADAAGRAAAVSIPAPLHAAEGHARRAGKAAHRRAAGSPALWRTGG